MPSNRYVDFTLDDTRYALPISVVERIVRAVEITPLPDAPDVILGVINVHGEIVPVADVRKRFGLPPRPLGLADHIVIAHSGGRRLALVADSVHGVIECAEDEPTAADEIVPGMEHAHGIARTADGLILVYDLDRFLGFAEQQSLQRALQNA